MSLSQRKTMKSFYLSLLFLFLSFSSNLEQFQQEVKSWPEFSEVHPETDIPEIFKTAYNNAKSLTNYSKQPKIPKIIHHIWLGSILPKKYVRLIKSWETYHPDWQHIL